MCPVQGGIQRGICVSSVYVLIRPSPSLVDRQACHLVHDPAAWHCAGAAGRGRDAEAYSGGVCLPGHERLVNFLSFRYNKIASINKQYSKLRDGGLSATGGSIDFLTYMLCTCTSLLYSGGGYGLGDRRGGRADLEQGLPQVRGGSGR